MLTFIYSLHRKTYHCNASAAPQENTLCECALRSALEYAENKFYSLETPLLVMLAFSLYPFSITKVGRSTGIKFLVIILIGVVPGAIVTRIKFIWWKFCSRKEKDILTLFTLVVVFFVFSILCTYLNMRYTTLVH